jgi:hypothetical protein
MLDHQVPAAAQRGPDEDGGDETSNDSGSARRSLRLAHRAKRAKPEKTQHRHEPEMNRSLD